MKNFLSTVMILSEDLSFSDGDKMAEFTDRNVELCGFAEKSGDSFIFFNKNRNFESFCFENSLGNIETYDSSNNFNGFVSAEYSLIKYDKKGDFQGYFISENGNLSEFDTKGSYLGYIRKEDDGTISKYDSMGKVELSLRNPDI